LPEAVASGYSPKAAYAGKCHLCWDIRRYFSMQGIYRQELSPAWFYGDSEKSEGKL
jgi:hypothetical protein